MRGTPRVTAADAATIRRSRWLNPLVLQPFVVFAPLALAWHLDDVPAARPATAWSVFATAALLAVRPGYRAQYRTHEHGFNTGPRLQRSARSGYVAFVVACGFAYEWLPTVPRAAYLGLVAGFLQGCVVGTQVVYARLLRAAPDAAAPPG